MSSTGTKSKSTRMLLTTPPALTHLIDEDVAHGSRLFLGTITRQDVIRIVLEKHYLERDRAKSGGEEKLITGMRHSARPGKPIKHR